MQNLQHSAAADWKEFPRNDLLKHTRSKYSLPPKATGAAAFFLFDTTGSGSIIPELRWTGSNCSHRSDRGAVPLAVSS